MEYYMKSQSDLHAAVLRDQGRLLGVDTSLDVATLTSTVKSRGEEILTLRLPELGAAFEQSLATEVLNLEGIVLSRGISKTDKRPRFMHGFFELVFDSDGVLLEHPSTDAIRAIRQVCHLHGKLKELPSPEKLKAAFDGYVRTDNEVSQALPELLIEEFRRTAREAWGRHFSNMEKFLYHDGFLADAKHGPGAVSQPLSSNGKWRNKEWTERLERYFLSTEYLNHSLACEGEEMVLHPPGQEPPARVIAVPKTAKSPRIITIEPVYNQFIQQGFAALFTNWMYRDPEVSFEFREPNQLLAQAGSRDGSYATIDLSEASDRISLRLVKELFGDHKFLLGGILACRSMTSELEDGTTVQLRKFASMGSALTFPIQTLVFATIAKMAVRRSSRSAGYLHNQLMRVYGDDIIVPIEAAHETVKLLVAFGLKVNTAKSFWTGRFRESCGGDYYAGVPVNLVRVRKRLPLSRSDVDEVVAFVAFRNLYWEQYGPTELVTLLDTYIERLIPFPEGFKETAGLVRWSIFPTPHGMDRHLQRPYVEACYVVSKRRRDPLDGLAALLKFFWTPLSEDHQHLQYAGRPVSANIKHGKVLL
jgi:hypothetical protein